MESSGTARNASRPGRTKSTSRCALAHRRADRVDDVGAVALQLGKVAVGAEHENAAVPEVAAGGEKTLRGLQVRLLDEALDREGLALRCALPDVAVAGVRAARRDAEHHERALAGELRGGADSGVEVRQLGNGVVGGHQQHDAVRVFGAQHQCSGGRGCRGAAARGLEEQRVRHGGDLAQLLGGEEAMLLVRDRDRRRRTLDAAHAQRRLLQHRALGNQRQELLRQVGARQRPEPGPRAAAQNHRNELHPRRL